MSQISEDLTFLLHPLALINGMKTVRQKIKFYNQVEEVFIKQAYNWLYQRIIPNTIVIDVGGFIGDTSIYFAMNPNVKKVMVYEPNPTSYKICKENIDSCPTQKIVLSNRAVSNCKGSVTITRNYPTGYNKIIQTDKETGIYAITINSILKSLKGKKIVIKCDAEEAEYKIFEEATNLKDVYAIMIEYHDGPENLKRILKQKGYSVEINSGKNKKVGYLMAAKKQNR